MSETLRWDFVGNDQLSDALDRIERALGKVERGLGSFGRQAVKAAGETEIIEAEIVDLGDKAERTDDKLHKVFRGLPAEIAAAKVSIMALNREFARTGDESLLSKITGERSRLSKLEGVHKSNLLSDFVDKVGSTLGQQGAPAGQAFSESFMSALSDSLPSEFKAALIVAGGTVVLALTPLIGGAIAGAVLGGVGVGGIVGGVALAAQDSRVQAVFSNLGKRIMPIFQHSADPFIEPLLQLPARLEAEFLDAMPGIEGIFEDLSDDVEPFARGLVGLVKELLPGIRQAVQGGQPVMQAFSRELPNIGKALSTFLRMLGEVGPEGAQAFTFVLRVVEILIIGIGGLIFALAKVFGVLAKIPGPLQELSREAADFANTSVDAFNDFGAAADVAADRLREFSDSFDKLLGLNIDSQHAAIAYLNSVEQMSETLMKSKRTLDIHTQAGRDNREAILAVVEAAERERQAYIAETNDIEGANRKFSTHIMWLRNTLQQMGYNTAQINEMLGAIEKLPTDINMDITLNGGGVVAGMLHNINSLVGQIPIASGIGTRTRKRALGGSVMAGQVYQVNEQGSAGISEYFIPQSNGRITTSAPGGGLPDETVLAPLSILVEGERLWTGLLAFKRRSGKVSLGLG